MRTAVYIDGFNLYYGSLKGTRYKWLDLPVMAQRVLAAHNRICLLKFFTAHVKPTPGDPHVPLRQKAYLQARSEYRPEVEVILGRFMITDATVEPYDQRLPRRVTGRKPSEKGTDVNLAVHLLNDGWRDLYDVAVVVSNDTDLCEAIRLVRLHCRKIVGLIAPIGNGRRMSDPLRRVTDFQRILRRTALASSQLPDPIPGSGLRKPVGW